MGDEATRDIERTLDEIAAAATLAGGRVTGNACGRCRSARRWGCCTRTGSG